jgi:hypothetical protein
MDMSTAAKAASAFNNFELMCRAIAALEQPNQMYFFVNSQGDGMVMPEETRGDLIRHFRKAKEGYQQDIENLCYDCNGIESGTR